MCSTWVLRKRQEQDPKEELVCKEVIEDPSLQMVRWRVMIDSFSGNGGTWNQWIYTIPDRAKYTLCIYVFTCNIVLNSCLMVSLQYKKSKVSALAPSDKIMDFHGNTEVGSLSHYLQGFLHPRWYHLVDMQNFHATASPRFDLQAMQCKVVMLSATKLTVGVGSERPNWCRGYSVFIMNLYIICIYIYMIHWHEIW